MMYLDERDVGYDPDCPNALLPLRPNCGPERIAMLTAKRPDSRQKQANWVIWNGVSYSSGKVQTGWEDNNRFFKYVKGARNRTWNGDGVARTFIIAEEGKSGVWKQRIHNNLAQTKRNRHQTLRVL